MAFPFVSEAGFEAGTRGHFDAESDTDARLDFAHASELARKPGLPAPYRGAYCMRVDLQIGTADAYVQETGSWDMTAGTNDLYQRFMFWFGGSPTMADADEFAIMEYWSGTNTAEAGVYINYTTANGYRIGIGKASASQFKPLSLNTWHSVETFFDPAGGGSGTLDGWLDNAAFTQVGSLTNANITSGVLGVVGQDAGTTAGTVLFDDIIADDARVYPPAVRFPQDLVLTVSGHAFIGPGCVENVSLMSGAGTDNVVSIYDTATADTNDATAIRLELKNTANSELVDPAGTPISLHKGCYVAMTGTNPRAIVKIGRVTAYASDGAIRSYALRR